jgi:hypothetical protein
MTRFVALQRHTVDGWRTIISGYSSRSDSDLLDALRLCTAAFTPTRLVIDRVILALAWMPRGAMEVEVVPMRSRIAVRGAVA